MIIWLLGVLNYYENKYEYFDVEMKKVWMNAKQFKQIIRCQQKLYARTAKISFMANLWNKNNGATCKILISARNYLSWYTVCSRNFLGSNTIQFVNSIQFVPNPMLFSMFELKCDVNGGEIARIVICMLYLNMKFVIKLYLSQVFAFALTRRKTKRKCFHAY